MSRHVLLLTTVALSLSWLGCVPQPEAVVAPEAHIKYLLNGEESVAFDGQQLTVETGTLVEFEARGTADWWEWSFDYGPYREPVKGKSYTNTFNEVGVYQITLWAMVENWDGRILTDSVKMRINVVSRPTTVTDLAFSSDLKLLLVSGGTLEDGQLKVVAGGVLVLDCTKFFKGGVPPYQICWLLGGGTILGRDAVLNWDCSGLPIGVHHLILRIIDSKGSVIERVLVVVIFVDEEPPPPPPPPAQPVSVSLRVNDSTGPVTVTANEDDEVVVSVSWGSANAKSAKAFGAYPDWIGDKPLQGVVSVVLNSGVYLLKIKALGIEGDTDTDTVRVTVQPHEPEPPGPEQFRLLSVRFSPPANGSHYLVGEEVTITVTHVGSGIIHRLMATSSEVGSRPSDGDGTTAWKYVWPMPTLGGALSHFWPDDKNTAPNVISVSATVQGH